jgi:hypothetical protein
MKTCSRVYASVSVLLLACLLLFVPAAQAYQDEPPPPAVDAVEPMHPPSEVASVPGEKLAGPEALLATKWLSMAGAGFIPSSSTMNWSYGCSGCVHPSTAGPWRVNLNLVDGSTVTAFWIGYWNYTGSTKTTGQIWKYDASSGTATVIATLDTNPTSSVGTGFKYVSMTVNLPISNVWNSYMFVWQGANPASVQELCYMQAGYTATQSYGSFLPAVRR